MMTRRQFMASTVAALVASKVRTPARTVLMDESVQRARAIPYFGGKVKINYTANGKQHCTGWIGLAQVPAEAGPSLRALGLIPAT